MKFGIIAIRGPEQAVDLVVRAERLGFHSAYLADHPSYGLPDTWTTLAFAAARTDRIRLGTHVVAAPLHHPTQLANQVATVDILSGGRTVLGIGAGHTIADFAPFGYERHNMRDRLGQMAETIAVVKTLWAPGAGSFDGAWYRLEGSEAPRPRPVQQPHPPVIVGVNVAGRSLKTAVDLADGVNTWQLGPGGVRTLCEAIAALGRDPESMDVSADVIYRPGATEAEAEAAAAAIGASAAKAGRGAAATNWHADGFLWGEPQQVIEQVARFAKLGASELTIAVREPEHLDQFAAEIMPSFAG